MEKKYIYAVGYTAHDAFDPHYKYHCAYSSFETACEKKDKLMEDYCRNLQEIKQCLTNIANWYDREDIDVRFIDDRTYRDLIKSEQEEIKALEKDNPLPGFDIFYHRLFVQKIEMSDL